MRVLIGLVCGLMSLLSAPTLYGNENQKLYQTYCSACHALDGAGVTGAAPPLKKSEWIQGDPARATKIVLHGLKGELTMGDEYYNLMMPPQGALLKDEQIAGILTYIRGNFGNKQEGKDHKVTAAMVAAVRKANEKKADMWDTAKLLEDHPFESEAPIIEGLIKHTYYAGKKKWQKLPDFAKLESAAVEEEHSGVLKLEGSKKKDHYGMVWEGTFVAEKSGNYGFDLRADDGARVLIGKKVAVKLGGIGPMSRNAKGVMSLKQGRHDFRVEYFQAERHVGLELSVRVPGRKKPVFLTPEPKGKKKKPKPRAPVMEITPSEGRVAIYRDFMEGSTPRSIAFGYPEGVNLVVAPDLCSVSQMWKGQFIDAGVHWHGRGIGKAKPMGTDIVNVNKSKAIMVKVGGSARGLEFWKQEYDSKGYPTFFYRVEGYPKIVFQDRYDPLPEQAGFQRELSISGDIKQLEGVEVRGSDNPQEAPQVEVEGQAPGEKVYKMKVKEGQKTLKMNYKW